MPRVQHLLQPPSQLNQLPPDILTIIHKLGFDLLLAQPSLPSALSPLLSSPPYRFQIQEEMGDSQKSPARQCSERQYPY